MNFRLLRTSLFLTTFFLLRFGFIQAGGYFHPTNVPVQSIHAAQPLSHDIVCLPIEITEDNEITEARKRVLSGHQAILLAFELFISTQNLFVRSVQLNNPEIPAFPKWLLLRVFRI